jgi:hypothetical protein
LRHYRADLRFRLAAFAPSLASAVLVRFGRFATVRFRLAAVAAFLMLRRAAARCFDDAMRPYILQGSITLGSAHVRRCPTCRRGSMRREPNLVTSSTNEPRRQERPQCDGRNAERVVAAKPESRLRWFRCRGCGYLWSIAPPTSPLPQQWVLTHFGFPRNSRTQNVGNILSIEEGRFTKCPHPHFGTHCTESCGRVRQPVNCRIADARSSDGRMRPHRRPLRRGRQRSRVPASLEPSFVAGYRVRDRRCSLRLVAPARLPPIRVSPMHL